MAPRAFGRIGDVRLFQTQVAVAPPLGRVGRRELMTWLLSFRRGRDAPFWTCLVRQQRQSGGLDGFEEEL